MRARVNRAGRQLTRGVIPLPPSLPPVCVISTVMEKKKTSDTNTEESRRYSRGLAIVGDGKAREAGAGGGGGARERKGATAPEGDYAGPRYMGL